MNIFSIVKIFDEFWIKIIKKYKNNLSWTKIQDTIVKGIKNEITTFFHEKNNLLSYENGTIIDGIFQGRFCLSKAIFKETIEIVHESSHLNFHKCYKLFFSLYFVWNLIQILKIYIKHCSDCQINQIKQHKFHDVFQSIQTLFVFFHRVIMNFILTLSKTKNEKFNCVMFMTCKFSKKNNSHIKTHWIKRRELNSSSFNQTEHHELKLIQTNNQW